VSGGPPDPVTSFDGLIAVFRVHNPDIVDMLFAKSEAEFLDAAERGLWRCIVRIESGAKEYRRLREAGLSKMLADFLSQAGFKAEAEGYNNGHVDVTIRHYDPARFAYLGECKIHDGYEHHRDGCVQVFGYCSGREQRVFSLDFFEKAGMYTKLAAIRKRFDGDKKNAPHQRGASRDHFIKGAFLTVHRHQPSGADVELLHLGCNLHVAGAPDKALPSAGASKTATKSVGAKPLRAGGVAKKKPTTQPR